MVELPVVGLGVAIHIEEIGATAAVMLVAKGGFIE